MFKKLAIVGISLLTLTACQNQASKASSASNQDENIRSENVYRAGITSNRYALSPTRGISAGRIRTADLQNMEKGLYTLSQIDFDPTTNDIREGKGITAQEVNAWLAPKSEENEQGLNPQSSASENRKDFQPRLLNSLMSYDFYSTQNKEGDTLSGVSLALALNQTDTFRDKDGNVSEVPINSETAIEEGKKMAETIISSIKKKKGYEKVPMRVALFLVSNNDEVGGGHFVSQAKVSENGKIGNWEKINESYVTYGVQTPPVQEDATAFDRFRKSVEGFFPQLSGVSGVGHYLNNKLDRLTIQVNTPFDGYSETLALIQQIESSAKTSFPGNIPITIIINGPTQTSAIVQREAEQEDFSYSIN